MMRSFDDEQEKSGAENALRSDQEILDEITNRLRDDPYLKEYDIQVAVTQGNVTLNGTIPSPIAENLVIEIVSGVPGVQHIENLIMVGVGLDVQAKREAQGFAKDPYSSENPNTVTPGANTPSQETPSEVLPFTREALIQDENMGIPMTGEGINTTLSGGVETTHADDLHEGHEGEMARLLNKGMQVVDVHGDKVGKVKETRSTDFLLGRHFARDIYVPYLACTFDGENVILNVVSEQVDEQGWARPKLF